MQDFRSQRIYPVCLANAKAKLRNFNNWSGGAEVSVVSVMPSYFPFIFWMSFSPQHLPHVLKQLKGFHVPAAVQSWIIFLLVLPPLTFGQEEEIKCTSVTSNTELGTKGEERKFPWGSWILFPGSVRNNWPGHCVHPVVIGSGAAGVLGHGCHWCHDV